MKRVIVIDMLGEESQEASVVVAAPAEEKKEVRLYAPSEGLLLETVSEEPFMETKAYYKALFDEYFKR